MKKSFIVLVTAILISACTASPTKIQENKSPQVTPMATAAIETGTIAGKLCYPSSFLPKGRIEAKNTTTSEITTIEYPGSDNGGKSIYELEVPEGTYFVRYSVDNGQTAGYHTSCTGVEPACQVQETTRASIPVEVKSGQKTENIALCDFYYAQDKEPNF